MAAVNQHHPSCNQQRRVHSGLGERGVQFRGHYNIQIAFNLECLGCCFAYLTEDREYTVRVSDDYRVVFPVNAAAANIIGTVSVFVNVPGGGGVKGQIKTENDLNLGHPTTRPFDNSRTYQMYNPPNMPDLAVGFPVQCRIESIAIDVVRRAELNSVYFNYADATLAERYRETRNPVLPSLTGVCLDSQRRDGGGDLVPQFAALKAK